MSARRVVLRFSLAFIGGYAFSAAGSSALSALLVLAGVAPGQAAVLAGMLGFPVYLAVLLWAFAARSPRRVAVVLLAGAACARVIACQLPQGLAVALPPQAVPGG